MRQQRIPRSAFKCWWMLFATCVASLAWYHRSTTTTATLICRLHLNDEHSLQNKWFLQATTRLLLNVEQFENVVSVCSSRILLSSVVIMRTFSRVSRFPWFRFTCWQAGWRRAVLPGCCERNGRAAARRGPAAPTGTPMSHDAVERFLLSLSASPASLGHN